MSTPGTRLFIGPLTPSQQRRRERNRERFREVSEIAEARYISMREAFYVLKNRRPFWSMVNT